MSTNYRIRKPYVLATLPQPFNPETGRFFVGDVFGHQMDAARKRRTEVIAAIDGESVSLYDIASSSLITSHPIPPEQSFSCPPVSLRLRLAKPHGTVRYTFAATHTSTTSAAKGSSKLKQRLTVFRDSVDANGKATSESQSVAVPSPSPVMLLDASTVMSTPATPGNARFEGNLIAVCRNGDVLCFNPEDLRLLWHQSGSSLAQDEVSKFSTLAVEHAAVVPVGDVIDGLFEGNADAVSSAFSRAVTADQKKRADVVVFVARVARGADAVPERLLAVLAVNPSSAADSTAPALVRLHVARLPDPEKLPAAADRQFRLHVASGSLAVVGADHLYVFDISRAIPRIAATMHRESACSMLRLSNHSLMAVSPAEVAVCNPGFGSVQALMSLDLAALKQSTSKKNNKAAAAAAADVRFDMLANFKKLDLVVGLVADQLVALPVEQPRLGAKKRQAEGLLIDSIGRGGPRDPLRKRRRPFTTNDTENDVVDDDDFFAAPLPGTLTAEYVAKMRADMAAADDALAAGDAARFDALLATQFSMTVAADSADGEWEWKASVKEYPLVDRRWVLYALTRAFALDEPAADGSGSSDDERLPELRVAHASTNLTVYLAVAGHFTLRNIRAAFRDQLENADVPDSHLARDAVQRLVDADPSMDLLRSYIAASKLTAVELLTAILMIMRSMGYVADDNKTGQQQQQQQKKQIEAASGSSTTATDSPAGKPAGESESDPDVDLQLDILEAELNATELYLDADSTRAVALAQAFGKLAAQSSAATVASLRATLQPHEVLALIRVLRNELVRGAWTTRYMDGAFDAAAAGDAALDDDEEPTVDGAITMVSDLLARCIDAVGMLGWMVHDGHSLGSGSGSGSGGEAELGDFLSALKLEVSAALQGLEECVVLEGLVGGVVRHGQGVARARAAAEKRDAERGVRSSSKTAVAVAVAAAGGSGEAAMLPLGSGGWMQAETGWKIDKAGEIVQRSQRELEHLLSKGTRIYSLEKLNF